ncbi:unnamed protein product, partial [Brenthis ino]
MRITIETRTLCTSTILMEHTLVLKLLGQLLHVNRRVVGGKSSVDKKQIGSVFSHAHAAHTARPLPAETLRQPAGVRPGPPTLGLLTPNFTYRPSSFFCLLKV